MAPDVLTGDQVGFKHHAFSRDLSMPHPFAEAVSSYADSRSLLHFFYDLCRDVGFLPAKDRDVVQRISIRG